MHTPINPSDEEMELNNESDWQDDDELDWTDDSEEPDEFEQAMDECGQMHGGGCMLAGTEYCDWDCPFSAAMYREMEKKRDSKGRYSK